MNSRYIFFILFLFIVNICRAQESTPESILPNISDTFIEKLVASAKAHYPKAKTFEDRVNIAQLNIQKARQDWYNIFSLNYLYSPAQGGGSSSVVVTGSGQSFLGGYSIGLSTSVGNILQKPTQVKIAKQEYDIAKLNEEEYYLNIAAIVKQRYYLYVQQQSLVNWTARNVESADHIYQETKHKFEKGDVLFDIYNSTYLSYTSTVQAKIQAETQLLIAKSNLEEIIGTKLEEIK